MTLRPTRILLVDDAADVRDVLATLLRAEGSEVVATATGGEALEYLAQRRFDVVLTDLGLPDIPGELVVRRAVRTVPRPRVIVVTGYSEPFVSGARAAGADVVLIKPIDWVPLLHALRGQESERVVVNL